jgi:hypothetical protein
MRSNAAALRHSGNEMVKKSAHSGIRLFDYLNGAVDEGGAQTIEAHLSVCDECASVATLIRKLKASVVESTHDGQSQIANRKSQISEEHPDINELALFYYAKTARAGRSSVASHVARCTSCAEAIAQYARAERSAAEYQPEKETSGEVPAKAWEMIRDWEESGFAKLKPASEVLGQELLTRLAHTLHERSQGALEVSGESSRSQSIGRSENAEEVPVFVISRSGEVRSVELFEQIVDPTGARFLRHAEGSRRFDNTLVHALLNLGETDSFVISELIRSDTLRLEPVARKGEQLRRVDYFIVEDGKE